MTHVALKQYYTTSLKLVFLTHYDGKITFLKLLLPCNTLRLGLQLPLLKMFLYVFCVIFTIAKLIRWARLGPMEGQLWPLGCMFDTPTLNERPKMAKKQMLLNMFLVIIVHFSLSEVSSQNDWGIAL